MAPRVDCRRTVTTVMVALAIVAIPLSALGAAPESTGPAVQVPEPDASAPVQPPEGSADAVPAPTEGAAPGEPMPREAATPTEVPATEVPATETTPSDAVPADALETEEPATATPAPATTVRRPSPLAVEQDDGEELSPSEAITAEYGPRYRPKDNPGRLNFAVRGMFANAGGSKLVGGRLGGFAADVGQSWNGFGYAATGTVWGGRLGLQPDTGNEINALVGIGPTIGLGRLALLGRGFLDLRLGYDFYYAVVNRRDTETILKGNDPGDVTLTKAKNLVPHGPRVRLDLGLVSLDTRRKFFHGFGLSMGYQALVGSLNGGLPPTHMLTLGLSYWMG